MPYTLKYALIIILILTQVGALIFLFINPTVSLWLIAVFVLSLAVVLIDLILEQKRHSK